MRLANHTAHTARRAHLDADLLLRDRRLEARFQWRRALSFQPTEKDRARILRKLEVGLDTVMAEEGAGKAQAEAPANAAVEAAENGN